MRNELEIGSLPPCCDSPGTPRAVPPPRPTPRPSPARETEKVETKGCSRVDVEKLQKNLYFICDAYRVFEQKKPTSERESHSQRQVTPCYITLTSNTAVSGEAQAAAARVLGGKHLAAALAGPISSHGRGRCPRAERPRPRPHRMTYLPPPLQRVCARESHPHSL